MKKILGEAIVVILVAFLVVSVTRLILISIGGV